METYLQNKPLQLRPLYSKVLLQGDRNLVLNHMQAGLASMELGRNDLAEESFERALVGIERTYANSETARKARSTWYEEGMKNFKGEPYERAMAYYYRGLAYFRQGDFQNARACFKGGVLQDAFAEEKQNRCDFGLLIFLEGWASQCDGDLRLAQTAYDEVKGLRPDFVPPGKDHNVLVIAETGTAPRKVSDGIGHYQLKYRRGRHFTEQSARVRAGRRNVEMYPMEDIAWQAMTRGGRQVDSIIKGQVKFKQRNEKIATVLTDVSATAMLFAPVFKNQGEISAASGALGLVGVAFWAISAKVKPRADIRYWNNLPDAVHVFTFKAPEQDQTVSVDFLDGNGVEIGSKQGNVHFVKGYGLGWIRSRSAIVIE